MLGGSLLLLLASLISVYASYLPTYHSKPEITFLNANTNPRPLVVWHGLGDSHNSPGMLQFAEMVKELIPGIFVHLVYLEEDQDKDRQAGFYGNVNDQIELVAQQLAAIPELQVEGGFDAMGFSQGGQFLRAYVERYNSPPVHNLITFGSQHMGISDIPVCRPYDFLCQIARRATKAGVYGNWAQENLVQAQYFRDPYNLDTYLAANHFLPDINNELPSDYSLLDKKRNETYAQNLASLNALVLIMFTEDKTVVPKESSWFGSEEVDESYHRASSETGNLRLSPDQQHPMTPQHRAPAVKGIIPMHAQPLYTEDWIGLRTLDKRGAVVFDICQGEHMQLNGCWEDIAREWVGK
ncbi:hypothetical protein VKT23_006451 [Stygiomarasmius scandens]|uniref:Palmitoyl-protein thioesterase 1 n=1 Tax=Marasmiellus scandens TaxID=2682957 RepID=A0ABR1JNG6_9AGAR